MTARRALNLNEVMMVVAIAGLVVAITVRVWEGYRFLYAEGPEPTWAK